MELRLLQRLKKDVYSIIILIVLLFLVFYFPNNNVLSAAEPNNSKQKEREIKTSINDLLNIDDFLFLDTDKPHIDAPISYLINANTGQVLYNDDGDYQIDILSVSKTLSAYVILDEMHAHPEKYNWDTRIVAEGKIVNLSYDQNFSNIGLEENAEYTLQELFDAMMIKSSNAATMLIGHAMFGGEVQFVNLIRKKAEALNLKHTIITTSTGLNRADLLPYGYEQLEEGNNRMTAEDVAFMTKKIIDDYPEILTITSKKKSTFGKLTKEPVEYDATNWLLPGLEYGFDGVDGLKTGADLMEYTSNVVFTAQKDNVRLIGVILGARNSDVRSEGAKQLLEYGFNYLEHKPFITKNSILFDSGTVKVKFGSKRNLPVTVAEDFILSTSYRDLSPQYIFVPTNIKYNPQFDAFEGAIKQGEVLGYITVQYSDLAFLTDKNIEHYGVDVIAAEDVGNGFFLFNFVEWIADRFTSNFVS